MAAAIDAEAGVTTAARLLRPALLGWLLPPAFALLAVLMGQDSSWNLLNHHRYNPWALLHGRWAQDLAPAGMQSYLNPLLDLPFWWLSQLPEPRLAGLLMGLLQGLCVLPLLSIARRLLPAGASPWLSLALATAGCLSMSFLSQLGSSAGDSSAAVLMLLALALLLRVLDTATGTQAALASCALAGLAAGLGLGLKPSNIPYALGAGLALLLAGRIGRTRPGRRQALVFGATGLLGLALSAAWWYTLMGQTFGNPLFPQFNAWFKSELALPILSVDTRWRPHGWRELLLFPLQFTAKPQRIHDLPAIQLLWPLVYLLMMAWGLKTMSGRWHRRGLDQGAAAGPAAERFFFLFLLFSYLVWLGAYGIGRHLVLLELLLPLSCWLLLHRLCRKRLAAGLATLSIGAALLFSLWHLDTSRRADWGAQSYSVQAPAIADPAHASVLVLGLGQAWLLPDFPHELAFVSLGSNFPESEAYERRARALLQQRGGAIYALIAASEAPPPQRWPALARLLQDWAEARQLAFRSRGCSALAWLSGLTPYALPNGQGPQLCGFVLPTTPWPFEAQDRRLAKEQAVSVFPYGVEIDLPACKRHSARIGQQAHDYQLCPARLSER